MKITGMMLLVLALITLISYKPPAPNISEQWAKMTAQERAKAIGATQVFEGVAYKLAEGEHVERRGKDIVVVMADGKSIVVPKF